MKLACFAGAVLEMPVDYGIVLHPVINTKATNRTETESNLLFTHLPNICWLNIVLLFLR